MIKLLALDLDGTLLYPKKKSRVMIRKNITFLRRFISDGGKVILVTGRNPMMQKRVEKILGIEIPILGCNGSFLIENGEVKQDYPIDNELGVLIYAKLKNKYGIITWLLLDATNKMYMTFHGVGTMLRFFVKAVNLCSMKYKEDITYGEKDFVEALKNNKYYKLMPVFGIDKHAKQRAIEAQYVINDLYGDKLFICESNNALEISCKGVNKGTALLKYCNDNGYSTDEVAVVGDSGNDIPMFENFRCSFAMAHSPKYVKEKASKVVKRVYEIEKFIYCLEKKEDLV